MKMFLTGRAFRRPMVLSWLLAMFVLDPRGYAQFTLDREPPGPCSRRTGLVISEIMYHPRVIPPETDPALQFIEIYNSNPWDEDLSGYSVTGEIQFTLPAGTVLEGHAYVVVARDPALVESTYDISNVIGPWDEAESTPLSIDRATIQLRNPQGAILLEFEYFDAPPWPPASDGTGHSLVLARPSFGENNPRAWESSDTLGGSPGRPEPVSDEPIRSVMINEWLAHTDLPLQDYLELYNHSNLPVDLSGAYLTDDPDTNKFRIPNGTTIGARSFLSFNDTTLGFNLFSEGETIYLVNSNQNRVVDAINFRGQSNAVASGRSPDGGPFHYGLATRTPAAANSKPLPYGVVINEIMYNPPSGSATEEWLEIHNRSAITINIGAWEFINGITYTFPSNLFMPSGAFWVVASDPERLFEIYPHLNTTNTFGPYDGTLSNGGERLTLAAADYGFVDIDGVRTLVKLNVIATETTYGDGGRWGNWSDARGSSLELIDPHADERLFANWADSDPNGTAAWTAIELAAPLGQTLGPTVNDSLILMLQGAGECLIDEIEVRVNNGPNQVVNGGFESGLDGWILQGSHDFSTIENEGFAGGKSLHLRAASRGDNQSNRILSAPFTTPIPSDAAEVSLRVKARWLRGNAELLLRLHGGGAEAYGRMDVPIPAGTPGMPNSRLVANAGPALYEVAHYPVLPAAGQPVRVTARATDPQGISSIVVRYRVEPQAAHTGLFMADNGTGGDEIMNDGIYTATIPGQPEGAIVAFYLEARDSLSAVGRFPVDVFPPDGLDRCWPNDALTRECVLRFGDPQMPGDFPTYHLWITSANSNRWHHRDTMNNAALDGTFVFNQHRAVYNALPLYSGSPWHRDQATNGPAGIHRVDYEMNFPDDDPLYGSTDFVLNNPGNPTLTTISDLSAVAEQTVYKLYQDLELPFNYRRFIHFFVNGSQRSATPQRPGHFIFEDSQQPNGEMIEQWFPNAVGGQLFKVDDWFEFEPDGSTIAANNDADLERRTTLINGQPTFTPAPYRFMFRKRSIGTASANDFNDIYQLVDAVSPAEDPTSPTVDPVAFATVADWEEWMRHFAIQRAVGNWDSYGWERGKNDYLYRPPGGLFLHMPWDIDYALGLGHPADAPLFDSNDPRVSAMFNTPAIARAYWRAFEELVHGPFQNAVLDPFIDTRVSALLANNIDIDLDAVAAIKTFIADRRAFLLSQLETVTAAFGVDSTLDFSTNNNLLILTGTAPVSVKDLVVNGAIYPITWLTVTQFTLSIVLEGGLNEIVLEGVDGFGQLVEGASLTLQVNYTGPVYDPPGNLVISEIMFDPATPDAQFIEIMNLAEFNFDLSGWRLEGAGYTFPPGSIVTNSQFLVLARDRAVFQNAYGPVPVYAQFPQTLPSTRHFLGLIQPGDPADLMIDGVLYDVTDPWPKPVIGASLQVIDPTQDNSRVGNWVIDPATPATPGELNSVAEVLPTFVPLWLNEVQTDNFLGPDGTQDDPAPWVELYNGAFNPISLDGYFLTDNYDSNLLNWPFPAGLSIPSGGFLVVWVDGHEELTAGDNLHTSFRLPPAGQVALTRSVQNQPQITDYLNYPALPINWSYGAAPDGQPFTRTDLSQATFGATNRLGTPRVIINEWMARNNGTLNDPYDGQAEDWFELYNAESFAVDLGGFYLTDNLDNLDKSPIPDNGDYVIPPGGFLLVWADDEPNQNAGNRIDLHAEFQLGGSSGDIALVAPDGATLVHTVTYGAQLENISEGKFSDGAGEQYAMLLPTPRRPNSLLPDYNAAPRFPVIPDTVARPGDRPTIDIGALDPDSPPQILTYSIIDAPAVSQLNQAGVYRWTIPADQPHGDYIISLGVTDTGMPPKTGYTTLRITVVTGSITNPPSQIGPPPVIQAFANAAGQTTLTFQTLPGRTYQVLYKNELTDPDWIQLERDFVAANSTASVTDRLLGVPHRFYVAVLIE